MATLGAVGSRIRCLSPSGDAAKAWAQLAQESLPRPGPACRAASMCCRYSARDSRLRSTMRWVTSAVTGCMVRTSLVRMPEDAQSVPRLRDQARDRQACARLRPPDHLALSLPRDQEEDGPRIEHRAES